MQCKSNTNFNVALALLATAIATLIGCAGTSPQPLMAELPPLAVDPGLERSPFYRDNTGGLSEDDLLRVIDLPVYLEASRRLGIVPVSVAYEPDESIPLGGVPEVLAQALEDTGFFTVTSEVSTDWPSDRSISGLRELAARYRTRYLVLYRHRFVERQFTNAWAATYVTLVAIPFVPAETLQMAGVLEATLFDVRTGTLMFTVYERVYGESDETTINNEGDFRAMRHQLLEEGAERLADRVVSQIHRLVAARPNDNAPMAER